MKEAKLRKVAICSICGKPFGHTGLPVFWRIKIEGFFVDLAAVQRQDGLSIMLGGNSALASIMGPDEEMTKPLLRQPIEITVCDNCADGPISIKEIKPQ